MWDLGGASKETRFGGQIVCTVMTTTPVPSVCPCDTCALLTHIKAITLHNHVQAICGRGGEFSVSPPSHQVWEVMVNGGGCTRPPKDQRPAEMNTKWKPQTVSLAQPLFFSLSPAGTQNVEKLVGQLATVDTLR